MSVSSHVHMKSIRSFEAVLLVWCLILICTASALLLMSFKAHAFTYENLDEMGSRALSSTLMPSSSFSSAQSPLDLGDSCRYLLKTTHFDNAPSLHHANQSAGVLDPNRRNAGTAAALSLMLGVRVAIAPTPNEKSSTINSITPAMWMQTSTGNPAYAVSAYRNCKKQEALREKRNGEQ